MAVSGGSVAAAVLPLLAALTGRATAQAPPPGAAADYLPGVPSISFFLSVFCPLFVILLFYACISMCRDAEAPAASDTTSSEASPRRGGRKGMDAAAIAALPLVFYREVKEHRIRDGAAAAALECAVCLLEFDDDDALRLLPTCPHVFHPDCIGLWLAGHVTCPLCRADLLEQPPVAQAQPVRETAASPERAAAVVIDVDDGDREEEAMEFAWLVDMQQAERSPGRAVPRPSERGHGVLERFALRLPEHVRLEILMSQRLRHATSAVASVRVREGSSHGRTMGSIQRLSPFVARVLSRLTPGGGKGGEEDVSSWRDGSSRRRREGWTQLGGGRGGGEGFTQWGRRSF